MIQIVKTDAELNFISTSTTNSVLILIPILQSFNINISKDISAIYIYDTLTAEDYLIGINSEDIPKHSIEVVYEKFKHHKKIAFNSSTCVSPNFGKHIDMELLIWLTTGGELKSSFIEIQRKNNKIYAHLTKHPKMNNYMPIMPFIDPCREIRNEALVNIHHIGSASGVNFYNNIILRQFEKIAQNGICIDQAIFKKFYNQSSDRIRYSKYNIFTKTGRPSITDDVVNFGALNKTNGIRGLIVSRFKSGRLIEFDYDSHHFRLMAELLNYTFPTGNIHEYFGKIYLDTEVLTEEQYEQCKQINFQQLYGKTSDEFTELDFFRKIKNYKTFLWNEYQKNGYIETPVAKRKLLKEHHNKMDENKIFNYLLQAYETEHNILTITKINKLLENKSTKLILYTYDSFLLDFDISDGKEILISIKNVIEEKNMRTVIKMGNNFNEMKTINF